MVLRFGTASIMDTNMTLALVVMGYLAFGLLLMDFMCPCWHGFEKLLGAFFWPISLIVGIVILGQSLFTKRGNAWDFEYELFLLKAEIRAFEAQRKHDSENILDC